MRITYNMKKYISYHHASTLLEVENKSWKVTDRIVKIMDEVEAYSAAAFIRGLPRVSEYKVETHKAVNAVSTAEAAYDRLVDVFAARHMSTKSIEHLEQELALCAQRLFRVLWDLGLTQEDAALVKSMLSNMGVVATVWEDIPRAYTGGSYTPLVSPVTGVLVFHNCMGFTFMQYEEGKAITGWSASLDVVEQAIRTARINGITEGVKVLTT